jgi:hypothetical protein
VQIIPLETQIGGENIYGVHNTHDILQEQEDEPVIHLDRWCVVRRMLLDCARWIHKMSNA